MNASPRSAPHNTRVALVTLLVSSGAAMSLLAGCTGSRDGAAPKAEFVGSTRCIACHREQGHRWTASQHAVAMQPASPQSVLGRFDSVTLINGAVTSTFFRRGNTYFVNTDGEDGKPHDYEIRWTFGVHPLQQYLVALGGGRLQALTLAWDSRTAAEGGQRWFSLEPGHNAAGPQDAFHWTGRRYNWNYACADCHATAVRKGYDERANSFQTSYAEAKVACEACHGPGSRHARWAGYPAWLRSLVWHDDGLPALLTERHDVRWLVDSSSGTPRRSVPRATDREIEVCAQCHALRVHIADGYSAGKRFLDYYIPVLLGQQYYPDGQQRDEAYNYGSFLQSKMYAAGVTCSDCHDPHSGQIRKPGNQLCTQCHLASKYDAASHHHHSVGGGGSACVSCHMPARTYMQVDPRRDHGLRIPRPDLTVTMGVPNACNVCHTDKTAIWASQRVREWYPRPNPGFQRFASAFAADDRHEPGAEDSLLRIANDSTEPWFVRASALSRLAGYPDSSALRTAHAWMRDPHGLVRLAALQIAQAYGASAWRTFGIPSLRDSTRAVRQAAAWIVAPMADSLSSTADRQAFEAAATEFVASQRYNADQPSNRMALGLYYAQRRDLNRADSEFRAALRLDPSSREAAAALAAIERARAQEASPSPRQH